MTDNNATITVYSVNIVLNVSVLEVGMLICFNCSPGTKQQLDELVARGGYADYADVIAAAVANQTVLSDRVAEGGVLVFGNGNGHTDRVSDPTGRMSPEQPRSVAERVPSVPALFSIEGLAEATLEVAQAKQDDPDDRNFVPASQWLWGQFNRFLPAKASCRGLARLQMEGRSAVRLEEAALEITKAAAQLGRYLTANDEQHGLKRDEATAIAFPHSGPDAWKSQQRYASQFVGSTDTKGAVSGMLKDLKLIDWENTRDGVRIRLSAAGLALASLPNPLLDGDSKGLGERLSEEEVAFLLAHIRQFVRPEDYAYRFLLEAIVDGATTPDALDDRVKAANKKAKPPMTPAFVTTQRSGGIARMVDLGLLERVRSGLTVTYAVTDRGQEYLTEPRVSA